VSKKNLKNRKKSSGGKSSGAPPKRGPNPQGIDAPVKSILEKQTVEYFGLKKGGTFDPEGSGYDYKTAKKFGIKPDKTGHMPSRAPSGQILKGRKHKTYHKTEKGEKEAGYVIEKEKDGKYYSRPLTDYVGSFKKGGCPHREKGVKSDIKGISSAQVSGKKFIGIR